MTRGTTEYAALAEALNDVTPTRWHLGGPHLQAPHGAEQEGTSRMTRTTAQVAFDDAVQTAADKIRHVLDTTEEEPDGR